MPSCSVEAAGCTHLLQPGEWPLVSPRAPQPYPSLPCCCRASAATGRTPPTPSPRPLRKSPAAAYAAASACAASQWQLCNPPAVQTKRRCFLRCADPLPCCCCCPPCSLPAALPPPLAAKPRLSPLPLHGPWPRLASSAAPRLLRWVGVCVGCVCVGGGGGDTPGKAYPAAGAQRDSSSWGAESMRSIS